MLILNKKKKSSLLTENIGFAALKVTISIRERRQAHGETDAHYGFHKAEERTNRQGNKYKRYKTIKLPHGGYKTLFSEL